MEGGDDKLKMTTSTVQSRIVEAAEAIASTPAEVRLRRFLAKQQRFTTEADTDTPVPPFPDLHVELMGMGDTVFWRNVMTDVIPSIFMTASVDDDRWNEYLDGGTDSDAASFAKLDELASNLKDKNKTKFRAEVDEHDADDVPFTFDVVYSVQTLCKMVGKVDLLLEKKDEDLTGTECGRMRRWVLNQFNCVDDDDDVHECLVANHHVHHVHDWQVKQVYCCYY